MSTDSDAQIRKPGSQLWGLLHFPFSVLAQLLPLHWSKSSAFWTLFTITASSLRQEGILECRKLMKWLLCLKPSQASLGLGHSQNQCILPVACKSLCKPRPSCLPSLVSRIHPRHILSWQCIFALEFCSAWWNFGEFYLQCLKPLFCESLTQSGQVTTPFLGPPHLNSL